MYLYILCSRMLSTLGLDLVDFIVCKTDRNVFALLRPCIIQYYDLYTHMCNSPMSSNGAI